MGSPGRPGYKGDTGYPGPKGERGRSKNPVGVWNEESVGKRAGKTMGFLVKNPLLLHGFFCNDGVSQLSVAHDHEVISSVCVDAGEQGRPGREGQTGQKGDRGQLAASFPLQGA